MMPIPTPPDWALALARDVPVLVLALVVVRSLGAELRGLRADFADLRQAIMMAVLGEDAPTAPVDVKPAARRRWRKRGGDGAGAA